MNRWDTGIRGVEMHTMGNLIINHTTDEEDNLTLILAGDLDIQTAPQLRNFIDRLVREGALKVRLDLSQLSYLDSSGYGALVDATRMARSTECNVDFANLPAWITEFFDLSALER
jgi:anti-sigma B factor antagonist